MKLDQIVPFNEEIFESTGELNVYYCGLCNLVLAIVKVSLDTSRMVAASANGGCPDCYRILDNSTLQSNRYTGRLDAPSYVDSRLNRGLLYAESYIPGLTDSCPGHADPPIYSSDSTDASEPSRLTVLSGANAIFQGHYESAVTALNGRVIFLDGGNSFNASYLRESVGSEQADLVLDNVMISRAFNYHQLTNLVTEKLFGAVSSLGANAVAIFEPTLLYEAEDVVDPNEAWHSFKYMAWMLRRISSGNEGVRVLLVVSNPETRAGQMLRSISTRTVISTRKSS